MEDPVACLAILDQGDRKKLSLRTGAYSEIVSALGKFTAVDDKTLIQIHDEEFEYFIDFGETTVPDKAKLKVTRKAATDDSRHLVLVETAESVARHMDWLKKCAQIADDAELRPRLLATGSIGAYPIFVSRAIDQENSRTPGNEQADLLLLLA
ncbi:hypothetical protein HPB52_000671 [Rhipicephalus sanguineus]|uniref:Uncharacterized protein n=1 Tax=Rhipicephalus sanguineus TaxID=34632 RepID=A0A9D4QFX8_RHISA|nr:hypothetical protein HPB52_000671 [Rhipicephalus sanguineus]